MGRELAQRYSSIDHHKNDRHVRFFLPYFVCVMALFALLPFKLAALLWFGLKVFGFEQTLRSLRSSANRMRIGPIAVAVVLCLGLIDSDVRLGQINSLVMAATILVYLKLNENWSTGIGLGLFVSKVSPLVFLPLLIFGRRWKTLSVGGIVVTVLGAVVCLRLSQSPVSLIKDWIVTSNTQKMQGGEVAHLANQSLVGVFARRPTDSGLYLLLIFGSAALVVLAGSKITHAVRPSMNWFNLFCCFMLLFSPDTRPVHEIQLFVPLISLGQNVANGSVLLKFLGGFNLMFFAILALVGNPGLFSLEVRNRMLEMNLHSWTLLSFAVTFMIALNAEISVARKLSAHPI